MIDRLAHTGRLRALDAEEKAARRETLLAAAERLYDRTLQLPGVADVAAEAGMAKGTVYLYFRSLEALYLSLHQRQALRFFDELAARLAQPGPFNEDVMLAIVDAHMIRRPAFLSLCNQCMAAPPDAIDEATHEAFQLAVGGAMAPVGAALERHLPQLRPGEGLRFLHQGYALLLGLYQLLGHPSQVEVQRRLQQRAADGAGPMALLTVADFQTEAHVALRGLWQQALSLGLAQADPPTARAMGASTAR
jgi:AcrR family transcriptional regulator